MNRFLSLLFGAQLALVMPAWAQWHQYPESDIPRTADGKLKVDAPAPKHPDGKPDFSGLWKISDISGGGNIGQQLEGGAPLQPWARDLLARRIARDGVDDPSNLCLPVGLMPLHIYSPFKIYHVPNKRIAMLYEINTTYRQIFLDGRPFPKDPLPSYMGYSVGHWEGDTLVVESKGFNGKFWIDSEGRPITDQLRLTERLRRVSFGRIEYEYTFDDPVAYTKPWTVRFQYNYVPDSELMEAYCEDNRFDEDLRDFPGFKVDPHEPQGPPKKETPEAPAARQSGGNSN